MVGMQMQNLIPRYGKRWKKGAVLDTYVFYINPSLKLKREFSLVKAGQWMLFAS